MKCDFCDFYSWFAFSFMLDKMGGVTNLGRCFVCYWMKKNSICSSRVFTFQAPFYFLYVVLNFNLDSHS